MRRGRPIVLAGLVITFAALAPWHAKGSMGPAMHRNGAADERFFDQRGWVKGSPRSAVTLTVKKAGTDYVSVQGFWARRVVASCSDGVRIPVDIVFFHPIRVGDGSRFRAKPGFDDAGVLLAGRISRGGREVSGHLKYSFGLRGDVRCRTGRVAFVTRH